MEKLTLVMLEENCRCLGHGHQNPVFMLLDCDEKGEPLPTEKNAEKYNDAMKKFGLM